MNTPERDLAVQWRTKTSLGGAQKPYKVVPNRFIEKMDLAMAYICEIPSSKLGPGYVDDGKGNYKGECVSLLKRMCSSIPATMAWKKGDAVKGNSALRQGTAIASFNPRTSKYWHAAIYMGQDSQGIWVWDQYVRGVTAHPPKYNLIKWQNVQHPHVAGENFFVIN